MVSTGRRVKPAVCWPRHTAGLSLVDPPSLRTCETFRLSNAFPVSFLRKCLHKKKYIYGAHDERSSKVQQNCLSKLRPLLENCFHSLQILVYFKMSLPGWKDLHPHPPPPNPKLFSRRSNDAFWGNYMRFAYFCILKHYSINKGNTTNWATLKR